MKNWQGNWIIAIAALHTLFAVIMFSTDYISLYDNGIINSLSTDRSAAAVWFFLFGQVLFIVGLLINYFDKYNNHLIPLSVSLNLLLLTFVGITIMPASGFWLMFPPVISLLVKQKKNLNQAVTV
ncbi:MAG: molecular chaperone GroEL [Colwellia sp.]|nr:molecular chaperone GroEL [Colwellia sp.]